MTKAKIPPRHRMSEKTRPENKFLVTRTKPTKIKKRRGIWSSRNPVMPPGSLNNSHSFQYAESISWSMSKTALEM
jgi:hypothetical protein